MRCSIQSKLIALLLVVALLPLCFLAFSAYQGWRADIEHRIGLALASDSQRTIDLVDRQLFFCREDIKAWAVAEAMQDVIAGDADGRITSMLMRLKNGYGIYSGIYCVDPEGKIVASSEPRTIGTDVSAEPWFQEVKTRGEVCIRQLEYDPLVHGFALPLTVPIRAVFDGDAAPVGYLSSRLNWSELYSIVSAVEDDEGGQSESAYAALLDQSGYVLAAPGSLMARGMPAEERPIRICNVNLAAAGMEAVKKGLAGEHGYLIEPDLDGRDALVGFAGARGYQDFAGSGWTALIVHDLQLAFAPVTALRMRFVAVLTLTIGACLVFAIVTGRQLSMPIRELTAVAGAIGHGDLEQRVMVRTRDEVGTLAISVNAMTGQLRDSRDALVAAKEHTDSILQSLSNGVITVDLASKVSSANRGVGRILQRSPDACLGHSLPGLFAQDLWVQKSVAAVASSGSSQWLADMDLHVGAESISVNAAIVPLRACDQQQHGTVLVFEDVTEEKRIQSTMRRYLTREVADRVMEGGEAVLGGSTQEASVLFADIRGLTTLSEALGPQETVALLNEYLTLMVEVILERRGVLDKYVGDGVMAVFGVPFVDEDDADRAVHAAIGMTQALRIFNRERLSHGGNPLRVGIGINTDQVVAGNIGSLKRMDYTVIGDGVNLAARLEGVTKPYGVDILIAESTLRRTHSDFLTREIDCIRVKGKERPVSVYEVLDGLDTAEFSAAQRCLEPFAHGLRAYRARQWEEAIQHFVRADRLRGGDPSSALYLARCQQFQKQAPPADWDSVWIMTDK